MFSLNCAQPQSHAISAYFPYFRKHVITLTRNTIVFEPIMLSRYSHKDNALERREVMRSIAQPCLFLIVSIVIYLDFKSRKTLSHVRNSECL
jgi:hypothetical protein